MVEPTKVANPDQDPNLDPALLDPSADPNVGGDDPSIDPEPDPNFLDVDERTSFKTREDAVKSYGEAGKRISELTPWVKNFAEEYGIESPEEAAELMDELVELRKGSSKPDADADKGADAPAPKSELSAEEKTKDEAANAWMEERGYIKKDALDAVQAEIVELRQSNESARESHVDGLIAQGRSVLSTILTDSKLPESLHARAERYVTAYLSDKGNRLNRQTGKSEAIPGGVSEQFFRGGDAQRAALQEAANDLLEVYSHGREAGSAGYQRDKEKAAKSNVKPVGKDNGALGKPSGELSEYEKRKQANADDFAFFQSKLPKDE